MGGNCEIRIQAQAGLNQFIRYRGHDLRPLVLGEGYSLRIEIQAHSPKLRLSLEIVRSRQKKRNSSPGLQHH